MIFKLQLVYQPHSRKVLQNDGSQPCQSTCPVRLAEPGPPSGHHLVSQGYSPAHPPQAVSTGAHTPLGSALWFTIISSQAAFHVSP